MIYIATFFAAGIAAFIEAEWRWSRIMHGDRRQLPHGLLLAMRIVCGIGLVFLYNEPWYASIPMAAIFAPFHRYIFNVQSLKAWDYLGSALYDRFWKARGGGWRPYAFEAGLAITTLIWSCLSHA